MADRYVLLRHVLFEALEPGASPARRLLATASGPPQMLEGIATETQTTSLTTKVREEC